MVYTTIFSSAGYTQGYLQWNDLAQDVVVCKEAAGN